MAKQLKLAIGAILKSTDGFYTKVISTRNGIYGITGWARNKKGAIESTVALKFVNSYGLQYGNVEVVEEGKEEAAPEPQAGETALDLSKAKGDDLKAYAEENGIDISGAKSVKDIREIVIAASQEEAEDTDEEVDTDDSNDVDTDEESSDEEGADEDTDEESSEEEK